MDWSIPWAQLWCWCRISPTRSSCFEGIGKKVANEVPPIKCQVIHISTNKRHKRHTVYRLHGHTLEAVDSGKYLGLTLSDDFSWHRHVDAVTVKASRTLGFLQRNHGQCTREVKSTAYTSLVRPVLEYASPAWDPTSSEGIVKLEKVQRQVALSMATILREILVV